MGFDCCRRSGNGKAPLPKKVQVFSQVLAVGFFKKAESDLKPPAKGLSG